VSVDVETLRQAMCFQRTMLCASRRGTLPCNFSTQESVDGIRATYVGERWSMVTDAPWAARAGTRVTAVAPLPMTTTRLPSTSRSAGQCCGWTTVPSKSAIPGSSGE